MQILFNIMKETLKLYLVTDRGLSLGRPLEEIVSEAVAGGATIVQLREKDISTGEFIALARKLLTLLKPLGIPLIINDRVDVALAVDAHGVHIGQSDISYEDARRLLGPDKIIGLSVESFEDIEVANTLDVDYIGISPVYGTPTKSDTAEPFGLEGLKKAVAMSVHPTVAIGGMNAGTIAEVMAAGTDGVAVVSAICSAENVREATVGLRNIIEKNSIKGWSKEVWQKSSGIYNDILQLPFIKELSKGTLAKDSFARYIAQDELYLKNYCQQTNILAKLIENEQDRNLFNSFVQSGMEGESALHQMLIEKYGIDTDVEPSEVTSGYNAHICEAVATGNPCIALASILPCMWIYNKVGLYILDNANLEGNPYKEWILEYGQPAFTTGVNKILEMADRWAAEADEQTRKKMDSYYLKAAFYEYAFWDCGESGQNHINQRGEFGLIEFIREHFSVPDGVTGIGDDCAIIPAGEDDLLVSTDLLMEGVHFLRNESSPEDIGWRAAAVNLSDIAAMGGTPVATFLSIALPADAQNEWAERFIEGYSQISHLYNVPLLGGDTTSSLKDIAVNVGVLGKCPAGKALMRSGAKVGDTIYVTGPLGDSAGGLQAILNGVSKTSEIEELIKRHKRPVPRINEGKALLDSGITSAMMDISDGIASDLRHIMKASGVGAVIELDKLPLSVELVSVCKKEGWDIYELATSGGEDFELLFTTSAEVAQNIKIPIYPVGKITEGNDLIWMKNNIKVNRDFDGYKHF